MDRQLIQGFIENGGGVALLVLSLAAAVSVLRSPAHTPVAKVLWIAFALCIPVAGAVVWFFVGRETPEERKLREATVNP